MKNLLVQALAILFLSATAHAQIGFKGGVNIASMGEEHTNVSKNDIENRSIFGPTVGLTVNLPITANFSIQPELLYTQNGGRNQYSIFESTLENEYRINYVEVPVLAKINLGNAAEDGGLSFHVGAGGYAGLAMTGKTTTTTTLFGGPAIVSEKEFTFDDEDNAKRLNYGLIGSVGIGLGHFMIEARYNYGLNNLLDDDANNTNDDGDVLQTRGIALTVGYIF